jgi:glutamate carboxypeptidase
VARRNSDSLFRLLEQLVRTETPTSHKAGNDIAARLAGEEFARLGGAVAFDPQTKFGDHLVASWPGTGPHVLIIGHLDTVWPLGTLERMGYTERAGRIYGPGVFDMKGGIAATVIALRVLLDEGKWPPRPIKVLLNTDEESGSPTSRAFIESQARGAAHVIVMEPGHGPKGAIKTRRKGLGEFKLTITGRAAHAGVAPEKGISAVHEMAHQIVRIQALADPPNGSSVNVGLVSGGSARNTVPAHAQATIDVRAVDRAQCARLEDALRSLTPVIKGAKLTVEGGFHRPPLERTPEIAALVDRVLAIARDMGVTLTEDQTLFGGGSDANLTAAMGVPTIDGLGAVGADAHAEGENIVAGELVNRAALLARSLADF